MVPYFHILLILFIKRDLLWLSIFDLEYLWEVQVYSIVEVMSIIEIEPLVGPTRKIMQQSLVTYSWHEFFPHGMDFHAKW
jgi:hypothetical protein